MAACRTQHFGGRAMRGLGRGVGRFAIIGLLPVLVVAPALGQGSNTSNPAATPATPPSTTTSTPQSATPFTSQCAQQSDTLINVTQAAGLAAELAAQAAPPPGDQAAEAIALGIQTGIWAEQVYVSTLPQCEETFTGTVRVTGGGVNVTGASIFNNTVGVVGNVNVSANVTASRVLATQGVSAMNGAINLGDPNGVTYSDGINIGGGAISGAGFGGAQAFTGAISAIAIGNGASAFSANSAAYGTGATARGTNSTAIGAGAGALFTNSAAFGAGATTTRANQQSFGTIANTYTMPGITSQASRNAQSGPLQLPTTDAYGNLASDGGATFKAIARVQAGVAVAMAMATPNFAKGEKIGVRVGWGGFNSYGGGANAFGVSIGGILAENTFSQNDRLIVDAGVAMGYSQFMGYREDAVIGGRAGLQLTW